MYPFVKDTTMEAETGASGDKDDLQPGEDTRKLKVEVRQLSNYIVIHTSEVGGRLIS